MCCVYSFMGEMGRNATRSDSSLPRKTTESLSPPLPQLESLSFTS